MKVLGILIIFGIGMQTQGLWASFVEFGKFEVFRGHRFGQLVPGEGDSFYTLGYTKVNMTYSIPTFRLYQNNRVSKEVPVKHLSATGNELDKDFFRFQDHLVLLTENKQFGKHEFFMHTVNLDLNEAKKHSKVLSFDLKINESLSHSGYVFDPDSSHLLLYALVEDATNLTIRVQFSIFDKHLNHLESGSKALIFPSDNTIFQSMHLSNDNNLMAVFKVYTRNPNRYHVRYLNLKNFFLVDLRKKENNTILLEIPQKKALDLVVQPLNNQNWLLTGLWMEESTNKSGFFSSKFDFERIQYYDEHLWTYFEPNQVTSSVGNSIQNKNLVFSQHRKSPLTNFIIRDFFSYKEGYVGVCEEYYKDGVFIENRNGGAVDNLTYNNNTVLVFHVNKRGEMLWTREINKTMKQTTNRNATPSIMAFTRGDQLTLLFNDNRKNYNESGMYNERNHVFSTKKSEIAVAQVHIDLDLGTVSRQMLTDYAASKGFFLPSKSTVSSDQSFIFLTFQQTLSNQMYCFGTMRLD